MNNLEYEVITEYSKIDTNEWEKFVINNSASTIFQCPTMYDFYKSIDNYEPIIIALQKDKKLVALLLAVIQKEKIPFLNYFTSRTIIMGGPILKECYEENREVIVNIILKKLIEKVKNKSIYIQFRNFSDLSDLKNIFLQNNFIFSEHLNLIINTKDEINVKSRMSKGKKRDIRYGLRDGAEIVNPTNINEVRQYYSLLVDLYKNKIKKPHPCLKFFEQFYNYSKINKLGKLLFIKYDNKIVGGSVCPITPDKNIYSWFTCGCDEEYKKIRPSTLATWAPIQFALENKLDHFDFLGAGKPDEDYGVRDFKESFGGDLVNYGRYERINNKFIYELGKFALNLIKKI